ncbi:DUF4282 domain-containing protein [Synechococcus sp. CBW1004]|uniref:DUF4282 domain-containing protein n=1 Tax=Synechococcus sp. CBW1004 TaxID=1353136 RepID=UPI0018CD72B9|nr:DUF4282 domain-containing protein [Synechococcus sp. CBW1004]QPN64481.1 DUF4282 domain-containing protein [Synechococcus sp. CBW1004]
MSLDKKCNNNAIPELRRDYTDAPRICIMRSPWQGFLWFLLGACLAIAFSSGGIGFPQCQFKNIANYPAICAFAGAAVSCSMRFISPRQEGEKSLFVTLLADYRFSSYAAPSVLSFLYAVAQGLGLGAATGYVFSSMAIQGCWSGQNSGWDSHGEAQLYAHSVQEGLMYAGICALSVLVARLLIEAYVLIYRVAQDISHYCRRKD